MTVAEAFGILRSLPGAWGASECELIEVESRLGARLPGPLRELMLRTGRGDHMRWLYPDGEIAPLADLPWLQEVASEILAEDPLALRPNFPFLALSQHDGYFFTFVPADGLSADPEILSYQAGRGFDARREWPTIGQSIAAAVRRATISA